MTEVMNSIRWAALIATLSLLLSVLIYNLFMNKYLKPMKSLLQVSDELSSGDLTKRVDIIRNDEIGQISNSFNNVADKMQSLIENLEVNVQERTRELHEANLQLESANKKSSPKMKKLPQISESNNGTTNRPENTAHFPV